MAKLVTKITMRNRSGHDIFLVPEPTTETVQRFSKMKGAVVDEVRPVTFAKITVRNGETRTLTGPYAIQAVGIIAANEKIDDMDAAAELTPAQKSAATKAAKAAALEAANTEAA